MRVRGVGANILNGAFYVSGVNRDEWMKGMAMLIENSFALLWTCTSDSTSQRWKSRSVVLVRISYIGSFCAVVSSEISSSC